MATLLPETWPYGPEWHFKMVVQLQGHRKENVTPNRVGGLRAEILQPWCSHGENWITGIHSSLFLAPLTKLPCHGNAVARNLAIWP